MAITERVLKIAKPEARDVAPLVSAERDRLDVFILASLMVGVFLMSYFVFGFQSLRLDESQSLWQTSRNPASILKVVSRDVHVPLYHMMLHYWQTVLGNGVYANRFLSLIFFIASIPAMYALGRFALGRAPALFGATLMAVSPFLNWYGNEIRMYSMMTLLAILNQLLFLKIMRGAKGRVWLWYFLTGLFGIYTHYFFAFVLMVQAFFFFLRPNAFPNGTFKKLFAVAAVLMILFAPWFVYVFKHGSAANTRPVIPVPTSVNVFNAFSEFLFGFQSDHLNTMIVSLWPLAVLLAFTALQKRKRIVPEAFFFLVSAILPIVLAFALSILIQPLFLSRYLILTVPSLYLFLAWIFHNYPPRVARIMKTGLVLLMLASLGIEVASAATPVKEDYRDVANYLEAAAAPRDVIAMSAPFTIYPLVYYYKGPDSIVTLPNWNRFNPGGIPIFNESDLPGQVNALAANYDRVWLVLSYDQGYQSKIYNYFENQFPLVMHKEFSPGLSLYEYRLQK